MADWIDAAYVANHADVTGASPGDVPLINATAAAAAWVQYVGRADFDWEAEGFTVRADIKVGTAMLAWRLYERRAAPLGVTTSPTGDPVEILRDDPDISRLLGIGSLGRFVFGAPTRVDWPQTT